MKKFFTLVTFTAIFVSITAFSNGESDNELNDSKITWYSIEEVADLVKDEPRKIFIDVYTDWCGWCKRMDATTFQDPNIIRLMNEYYYAVKLDGEEKDPINFRGTTFEFVPSGRKGYNQLAAELMQGKLSYPTVVFMDENLNLMQPLPGYRTADQLAPILTYLGEDHYKNTSWEEYVKEFGK